MLRGVDPAKTSPPSTLGDRTPGRAPTTARLKVLVALVIGAFAAGLATVLGAGRGAPLCGWDAAAVVFCVWTWIVVWRLNPSSTASHSQRENPSRALADAVLLGAAIASLIAVGAVLFGAAHAAGNLKYLQAGFAVVSVLVSWVLIHTVFTLEYARLFYAPPVGGIDFNERDQPQYSDFAYLSFTVGMTFQVSDPDLQTKLIRRTALRHALISFPLGTVIIAASINLVSGLAK